MRPIRSPGLRRLWPARRSPTGVMLAAPIAVTLAAAAPARAAPSEGALQAHLTHELAISGPRSGAYVYDLTTKTALSSERADIARAPASVEKLYTATTALELMG